MAGFGDITALSEMLQETSNQEDHSEVSEQSKAFSGPSSAVVPKPARPVAGKEKEKVGDGNIWNDEEVPDEEVSFPLYLPPLPTTSP